MKAGDVIAFASTNNTAGVCRFMSVFLPGVQYDACKGSEQMTSRASASCERSDGSATLPSGVLCLPLSSLRCLTALRWRFLSLVEQYAAGTGSHGREWSGATSSGVVASGVAV